MWLKNQHKFSIFYKYKPIFIQCIQYKSQSSINTLPSSYQSNLSIAVSFKHQHLHNSTNFSYFHFPTFNRHKSIFKQLIPRESQSSTITWLLFCSMEHEREKMDEREKISSLLSSFNVINYLKMKRRVFPF